MEIVTPKVLCDLYSRYSKGEKDEFLKRLARISSGREIVFMVNELPKSQQWEFSSRIYTTIVNLALPLCVSRAAQLVQENPDLTHEALKEKLALSVTAFVEDAAKDMSELRLEQFKKKRERKSDPETVQQNIEICDLRKKDKRRWSLGALAKKFGMARQSVSNVLKEEEKWRRLFSENHPT
jgi:hypothetical protein